MSCIYIKNEVSNLSTGLYNNESLLEHLKRFIIIDVLEGKLHDGPNVPSQDFSSDWGCRPKDYPWLFRWFSNIIYKIRSIFNAFQKANVFFSRWLHHEEKNHVKKRGSNFVSFWNVLNKYKRIRNVQARYNLLVN